MPHHQLPAVRTGKSRHATSLHLRKKFPLVFITLLANFFKKWLSPSGRFVRTRVNKRQAIAKVAFLASV